MALRCLTFFLSLSLLYTLIHGLPLTIQSRAVSSTLLNQLSYYEQYAAAAYCASNNAGGVNTAITCVTGNCPLIQQSAATSLLEFQNIGPADTTGFVALDHTQHAIVISYRGTKSISNWISDLDLTMTSWSICSGCEAHAGFYTSWLEAKSIIQSALASAHQQYPSYAIVVTGHSLGAATATICAADLRSQGYSIALYTYGSPMVGNSQLADFISGQSGGNYRVTHAVDLIPKLPGYLLGFRHVSGEYWIRTGDNVAVTASSISVSTGTLDFLGNQGTLSSSLNDHQWYFNDVTLCAPPGIEFKP